MVKVGCCGFPINKKEYFKKFSLVELQSTFYEIPAKIETVKKWREEAPKDFEFTLKAFQVITHDSKSPTYKRLKENLGIPKITVFLKTQKKFLRLGK
jgi:uncharacterized protein YecE (DUF72 family)